MKLLGLDIGGSNSRARLTVDGKVVEERSGPGANVTEIDAQVVAERLAPLVENLPAAPDACCAGAAGVEVPRGRALLEGILRGALPGSRIEVVHDTRLILAAAGFDAGIALIAGTGTVCYGRNEAGIEYRAGGWGWLVGDDGGGVWMAREAAREVMRRHDAGAEPGVLGDAFMSAAGVQTTAELLGKLHGLGEPGRWAALAGSVLASAGSDPAANEIVKRAANELCLLIDQVRFKLGIDGPVVLAGGLILNQKRLETEVRKRFPDAVRLEAEPVEGALRLAAALA